MRKSNFKVKIKNNKNHQKNYQKLVKLMQRTARTLNKLNFPNQSNIILQIMYLNYPMQITFFFKFPQATCRLLVRTSPKIFCIT